MWESVLGYDLKECMLKIHGKPQIDRSPLFAQKNYRASTALQARRRASVSRERGSKEGRDTAQQSDNLESGAQEPPTWGNVSPAGAPARQSSQTRANNLRTPQPRRREFAGRQQDESDLRDPLPSRSFNAARGQDANEGQKQTYNRQHQNGRPAERDAAFAPGAGQQFRRERHNQEARPYGGAPLGRGPSYEERGGKVQQRRAVSPTREPESRSSAGEPQLGWADFTRQQNGHAGPQQSGAPSSPPPRNHSRAKPTAEGADRPWQGLADAQQRRAQSQSLSHKDKVLIQISSNQVMVNAFGKFVANVADVRHLPDQSQKVLQIFVSEVQCVLKENDQYLDPVNVSTALYQLEHAYSMVPPKGQNFIEADQLLAHLMHKANRLASSFKIDPVVRTVSAIAKLSMHGPRVVPFPDLHSQEGAHILDLLESLAKKAFMRVKEPPNPEPFLLATMMWAYSRVALNPLQGKLFDMVDLKFRACIQQCDPQNLANFMNAAATLEHKLSDLTYQAIAEQATLKMPKASSQGVSNLLWAFAKIKPESPLGGDLFRSAFTRISEIRKDLKYTHVANILRACAIVGHPISPAAMKWLTDAAMADLPNTSLTTLCNLLVAVAKGGRLEPSQQVLFLASLNEVDSQMSQCDVRMLINSIWAVASLGVNLPTRLLKRMNEEWAERILELFPEEQTGFVKGQQIANILWAYAKLRLDPLEGRFYMEVLSRMDSEDVRHMSPQSLSNMLLGAASVQRRHFSPKILNQVLNKLLLEANDQELCNTLWSLSALGLSKGKVFSSILQKLQQTAESFQEAKSFKVHARQVVAAYTVVRSAEEDLLLSPSAEELVAKCREKLAEEPAPPTISKYHEDVSSCLESMMIPHAIEFASPDGLLSVDIVTRCGDGSPLAIEVDGEKHFTALPPYRPLGHTVLRNILITNAGFRGFSIPFYDWERLSTFESRKEYLGQQLERFGIALEGGVPLPAPPSL